MNKTMMMLLLGIIGVGTLNMGLKVEKSLAEEAEPVVQAEASFTIVPEHQEGETTQYFSVHLQSERFVFIPLDTGKLVIQESIDLEESTMREYGDGRVTVTAYKATPTADDTPFWQFSANGRSGDFLFGEYNYQVYRLKQAYCCDISAREIYYDLHTGAELFSTTTPAFVISDHETYRYIGYDDGYGNEYPSEMEADKTISGILSYSGAEIATQKLAIFADPNQEYREQDFSISINGISLQQTDDVLHVDAFRDELLLRVDLRCRCETDEFLEIPIVNDTFVIEQAVVSPGITVKALPAGSKPSLVGSGQTQFTDPFAYCAWMDTIDETDGTPEIVDEIFTSDPRGFLSEIWYHISPESRFISPIAN